jgi:hypothetical protein
VVVERVALLAICLDHVQLHVHHVHVPGQHDAQVNLFVNEEMRKMVEKKNLE